MAPSSMVVPTKLAKKKVETLKFSFQVSKMTNLKSPPGTKVIPLKRKIFQKNIVTKHNKKSKPRALSKTKFSNFCPETTTENLISKAVSVKHLKRTSNSLTNLMKRLFTCSLEKLESTSSTLTLHIRLVCTKRFLFV